MAFVILVQKYPFLLIPIGDFNPYKLIHKKEKTIFKGKATENGITQHELHWLINELTHL